MLKVVIDTNVFVSATITEKGKPSQILKAWREKKLEVIISPEILKEIGQIIFKSKIKKISFWTDKERYQKAIKHAPDRKFLVAAVEGKADYIVSGDRHLRDLKIYKGIKIASVAEFLQILENKRKN